MAIAFICLLVFSWKVRNLYISYFCFDNPNSMSEEISKKMTMGSESKYNLLYSVYSYPNIILPLFGGLLIDKMGLG